MKATRPPKKQTEKLIKSENLFPVVGIGASAGGLEAFKKLLKAIPEDSGMAYVLVQHLDPTHESMLPEILQKVTRIPVMEITDDIKVEPNHIYVIPSNKMMLATDGVLLLGPRPERSKTERHLPIDLFFSSLAEVHQAHAIGVVLSGTATDGTLGLKAIKDHGGITFAQDEASAAYEGMPNSAVQAGVVDFILPPDKIPEKLLEVTRIISTPNEQALPLEDEEVFKQIIALLRVRKGTDFAYYKQTTIRRRILRRMAIMKQEESVGYLKYLREDKHEQDALYQDLLIPVTSFFRDAKSFEHLNETILSGIIKNKVPNEPIRIWVAGCSTGEEAYSIAICFKEFLSRQTTLAEDRFQIFASDLSEPAITKARIGIYSKMELAGVSAQRLNEFFTKTKNSYQVNRQIRDRCVFAKHNFLKDPPFGRMDLISCRNVLIYMEPYLQKKALTTFHYALNQKGFLWLGKSETTSGVPELFSLAGVNDKFFTRKDTSGKFMVVVSKQTEHTLTTTYDIPKTEKMRTDFQRIADDIMLSKYTPAGVMVNEAMDIVQFRGTTSNYLEQAAGKPSHNLIAMARHGLGFELRNLLYKAKKEKGKVVKESIPVEVRGTLRNISVEAIPLPNTIEPHYLILFHDTQSKDIKPVSKARKKAKESDKDIRIQQLEKELEQAREDMRGITEEQEAANEELQSANEELLSSSEELQSLNEELETGKEELQSTNEELMVVNNEIVSLNESVTEALDYAEAIVSNIREPLLVLDRDLRIKTANQAFYKTFKVNEYQTEGVLIYDLGNKQWNIPALRTLLEKILPEKSVFADFEVVHAFSLIGERVMLLNAREVINRSDSEKLILLSIEDITERKKAEEVLHTSEEQFRNLVKGLPAAVYSCDEEGRIVFFNEAAVKLWGRKPTLGKDHWHTVFQMFNPDGSPIPIEKNPLTITLKEARQVPTEKVLVENPDGGKSILLAYPQPEFRLSGEVKGAINMLIDVTEQVMARRKLEESEYRYRTLIEEATIAAALLFGPEFRIQYANELMIGIWGKGRSVIGKTIAEMLPELEGQPFLSLLNNVYSTGKSYTGTEERAELTINGERETFYFNYTYKALLDKEGKVYAIHNMATDVTKMVLAKKVIEESEKQKDFLLKLIDVLRMLDKPGDIEDTITKTFLEFMDADRCYYSVLEEDNAIIKRDSLRGNLTSVVGVYSLKSYSLFKTVFDSGHPYVYDDVQTTESMDEDLKKVCLQLQLISMINVPVIKNGKPVGILSLVQCKPRKWTDQEVQLTIEVADRTWAKIEKAKSEEALRISEEKYRTLLTSIDQGFTLCELIRNEEGKAIDLTILEVNPTYEKQTGINREMVIGKPLMHVFPSVVQWLKIYTAVVDDQRPIEFEHRFEETDRWFSIKAYPVEQDRFAVLFSNITERKHAEEKLKESEKQFRQMAELMPQKISSAHPDGTVFYYNQSWLTYTGLSLAELLANGWSKVIHPDELEEATQRWQQSVVTGNPFELEARFLNKAGEYRWHLSRASAIKAEEGTILNWVGTAMEIQGHVEQREELERAVVSRTRALGVAYAELLKKNLELESFAYVSSHDLQEPLRKIQIFAGRILERENQHLSEKGKEDFESMRKSAKKMRTLIEDVLTFSRLGTGKAEFKIQDLHIIMEEVIAGFKEAIEEKQAIIVATELCHAKIIDFQFRQLVHNLISNALKFSKPGLAPNIIIKGKIIKGSQVLEMEPDIKSQQISQENYCHLSFVDNGIGFEKEFSEKIFEMFQKLHSTDEYSGTGIGLAIVKKIVDNHNGFITTTSELNKGTTFNIYIPN